MNHAGYKVPLVILAAASLLLSCVAVSAATIPRLRGITYADYNSELRESVARSDGIKHVNTPRLIQKLKAGNITTYAYLVWHQKTDWDDFRLEFLPAAQSAGLKIWLYLTPPTENNPPTGYVPFGTNYVQWAVETAKLASQYPALTALAIDDFNGNEAFFTPRYVSNMMAAAHLYCTNLMFLPVNYDLQHRLGSPTGIISPAFANAYGPYCGGVIFPYLNWDNKNSLANEMDQITLNTEIMRGEHAQFVVQFPANTQSAQGAFSALSQTITHLKGFPDVPYPFSFQISDSYSGATSNYHKLQVLVGDRVAWEGDVAGATGVRSVTVNLQSFITGSHSSTITVRMFDAQGVSNFGVTASWILPGADWTLTQTGAFVGKSTYYPANPGLDVPLIVMIYDGGYGSGTNRWTPTPDYVQRANQIAFESVRNGAAAGIIQYCLDKTDASQQFPIVRDLYGQWLNHPWFDKISVQGTDTVIFSGCNGPANQKFTIRSSPTLPSPYSAWSVVTNGTFDSAGEFTYTNSSVSTGPWRFYRLSVP